MFELQYISIGIIQGITEFLPISSSAHLIIFSNVLGWEDQGLLADIAVHVGTLGAVIVYLFSNIKRIFIDFFSLKKKNNKAFKIIIATIPALLGGFFVYEYLLEYIRNLVVIGWASIIFGILLFFVDHKYQSNKNWEEINFYESFIVGCFQVFAFIPGASRAGVTITGARFLKVKRESAAIFSMLLSIPIILASLFLALFDILSINTSLINFTPLIASSIISFFTAIISIHLMMKILQFTNFNIFIIYRIFLGIALLLVYA